LKVIGLTGGIGSGKTTVARVFKELGIPVFNADEEAKKLYQREEVLQAVKQYFSDDVFTNDVLDFKKLGSVVFTSPEKLKWLNSLLHPLVGEVFEKWKSLQKGSWCIKESAILFESGSDKQCDVLVSVEVNEEERVKRVIARDGLSEKQVRDRMNKQMDDDSRQKKATYIIDNNSKLILRRGIHILNSI